MIRNNGFLIVFEKKILNTIEQVLKDFSKKELIREIKNIIGDMPIPHDIQKYLKTLTTEPTSEPAPEGEQERAPDSEATNTPDQAAADQAAATPAAPEEEQERAPDSEATNTPDQAAADQAEPAAPAAAPAEPAAEPVPAAPAENTQTQHK